MVKSLKKIKLICVHKIAVCLFKLNLCVCMYIYVCARVCTNICMYLSICQKVFNQRESVYFSGLTLLSYSSGGRRGH